MSANNALLKSNFTRKQRKIYRKFLEKQKAISSMKKELAANKAAYFVVEKTAVRMVCNNGFHQ